MAAALDYLSNQSPVMIMLFAMSVMCGAAVLDRTVFWLCSALRYALTVPNVFSGPAKREQLFKQLHRKRRRHYIEDVVLVALQQPADRDRINQVASEQIDHMSRRLGMLDLIARIAPLVGILGTVVGMALSFGNIGAIANASPTAISGGISLALQTTAFGLIISIFASIAAAIFRKYTKRAALRMSRAVCEIQHGNELIV